MGQVSHLYDLFQPKHYQIYLDINREKKTFTGVTKISGNASQKEITLHQKFLNILDVKVNGNSTDFKFDDNSETVSFNVPNTGDLDLEVSYSAKLTDSMMGIYPSYYEVDGVKKQLIGTQFETTFARQAFPSIDEPVAKATFDLAIKFDEHEGETVLSNMPEVKTENGVHYFDTTVRMSTYLVAFAFGELQSKLTETKSGVKIGVFSTKAHAEKELDFALDIAKRSIEFYEDYYQTPYPLPHSWQLALPDFSAGAMENWGLVTYREAYLLLNPDNTSLDTKRIVATVIAHELAHQWFGDLVTMKWWDDLWLNESFANMMEYVAIDALQPDWNIWELFQTSEAPQALQRDATDGVQSVHVEVRDPAEIDSLFDPAIVYAKGSRLLVMVRALIGDEALRSGLKAYFKSHKYNNAVGSDLWKALGEASNLDIGSIMNSWLEQPGYPVLNVNVKNGHLVVKQNQFFIGEGKDVDRLWQVPLHADFAQAPKLLTQKELDLGDYQELRKAADKPLRFNVGNTSHVVVNYAPELLEDILVNSQNLTHIDKLQLLQDLRLLADSGLASYSKVIPLLKEFSNSDSAIVNETLYSIVNNLKFFVTLDSTDEANLKKFVNTLSADQVQRLSWLPKDTDSNDDQLVRPLVLSAALYAENSSVESKAHEIFTQNQDNLLSLSSDIRALVLQNEVKNYNSPQLFASLLKDYRKTSDSSYKKDILFALTSTKDTNQVQQIVSHFEDADTIKPQDLRTWYFRTLSNNLGEQVAWDWIRNDWKWLEDTVGGDMEFTSYITVTARALHTEQRLAEFKEFFEPKLNTPGLTREIIMDTKVIESRVSMIERDKSSVNDAISTIIK
ncbi:M1 family metallopeptidase [Ligilactobacillus salivarius]|uniref:M1 family metallopeptidase n=1 Tax=Ligilactobacillus salivarius TaxID=1624 RepID=UPI002023569F|nr:M1 family metallopeptidase [Ligilactobacillus salivarius]URI13720.1 M1 family metallopeptidase [Ligilactobacillus salivarius]UUB35479.1 M1 family metallopeptidase [Ligilactobacillus salivarius]